MQLRYYQRDAKSATLLSWDVCRSTVINTPTGSGKTTIGASIIGDLVPERCLFCGDTDELCVQPYAAISRMTGIIPGLEKASSRTPLVAQVTVGSVQTLSRKKRIERFPKDHFKYIILDEAHRSTEMKMEIANYFPEARIAGMTATAYRKNLRDLSKWFEDVAFSMPMLDLIDEGFAPILQVLQLPVEVNLEGVKTSTKFGEKDYKLEELDTKIAPHYREIASLWKKHAGTKQTVAFLPLKKSAFEFAAICREMGITAKYIAGDSQDRDVILAQFENREFTMLVNSQLCSTGVDLPTCECILPISPTHSMSLYWQRLGRAARVLPGLIDHLTEKNQAEERKAIIAASAKPTFLVIDFFYQHDKLGAMHAGHLFAQDEEQARAIFDKTRNKLTPQDLIELMKKTQAEKERNLVEQLEKAAARGGSGRLFDARYAGVLFGNPSITNFEGIAKWECEPATEKQIAFLSKRGIATSGTTKGLAGKLCTEIIHRMNNHLATIKQVALLREKGVIDAHAMSFSDASAKIGELLS